MNKQSFANLIKFFDFKSLFNELGWDNFNNKLPIAIEEEVYSLEGVVEKKGFTIFQCLPDSEGRIPTSNIRKQIENRLVKYHFEHLVIYSDLENSHQVWQLAVFEEGKPKRVREISWYIHQDTELLFQRLKGLLFTLDEEEKITLVDVKRRVSENFAKNTEQVTKKFYVEFKSQHTAFLEFIEGIEDTLLDKENNNKQWYASLMLNRLMFCYFIQKKGFLDQNRNYLHEKLKESSEKIGSDNFYSFYRSFLLELFHEGLGKPEGKRDLHVKLGNIPYLNGGLFDVHELEKQFDEIHISDEAFEKIFTFFDQWNWHLDNRFEATGRDINPDVIGYIFEKYINDRASMGAYYTKEDITDYIGKNTIIPYLFDETKRLYPSAFKADAEIWQVLGQSGDTYIYDAVKKGVEEATKKGTKPATVFDLQIPDNIYQGLDTNKPELLERKADWNTRTEDGYALPTEIWRETIERWKRYFEVKNKIDKGEINQINDFITYNLNIRQFVQDFIENTDDPYFIRHFYRALKSVTILDPTCGSGAFLFAALNILEPLYEACITRMKQFVEEQPNKHKGFEEILSDVNTDEHPNLDYYIYKSIILNNLFGVDIMKEAVEIAKLRLFLKLVATVDLNPRKKNYGLEPLPDIDFNIRAGNTLVGFATEEELLTTIQKKEPLFAQEKLDEFKEEFDITAKAFKHFQNKQLIENVGSNNFKNAKGELIERLKVLNDKLNRYLATNYNIDPDVEPKKYLKWLNSHQPFHWVAEYYQIIKEKRGFDVIIGNPPYVKYSSNHIYKVLNFETIKCGDLYSLVVERCIYILNNSGFFGYIIPLSSFSTEGFSDFQSLMKSKCDVLFISNFDKRPGRLFDVEQRVTIVIGKYSEIFKKIFNTNLKKWYSIQRENLFQLLSYNKLENNQTKIGTFYKIESSIESRIISKISSKRKFHFSVLKNGTPFFYKRRSGYFLAFFNFIPKMISQDGTEIISNELKKVFLASEIQRNISCAAFNSSLFWWFFAISSDFRHLNVREVVEFHFDPKDINPTDSKILNMLNINLMESLDTNSISQINYYPKYGKTSIQTFYHNKSKDIIDQIDIILSQYYGFNQEELDFIINYDIKYRMGKALFGEQNGGEEE